MTDYQIPSNCYVLPTPAGAYYAVSSNSDEPPRRLLLALMSQNKSQLLSAPQLCKWTGIHSQQDVLDLLYRIQSLSWIQGEAAPREAPAGSLEDVLPSLLARFSGSDKALLADNQGFYLATHGFPHEAAEELSALSADLASLHRRHQGLLDRNLGMGSSAWALVDAVGNSQLGFWPLNIGKQQFVLVLSGLPKLNQPAFVNLIWTLTKRYNEASKSDVSVIRSDCG